MRFLLVLFISVSVVTLTAQEVIGAFMLGETSVSIVKHDFGRGGYVFFNMHDNENTGVEAAKKVLKKTGGTLYELVHSGERYISFEINGTEFQIDPNRIYTDTGVWRELERAGHRDSVAFEIVQSFGRALIDLIEIDAQGTIVALHNNTEDNYSTLSYVRGGDYESDAEAVFTTKGCDPDEFYFVTTARLYGILTTTKFNVVLQNNTNVTDDGSLSVYCGQNGIEYVNVEAQHEHKGPNKRMLKRMLKAIEAQEY